MYDFLQRTEAVLGADALEKLANSRIALLGLGGVGGAAAEGLARSGVGSLLLVDNDVVSDSNRNRQLLATVATVGQPKAEAARARVLDINPACAVTAVQHFYLPDESDFLYQWQPDVVLDALDTVTAKLHMAQQCTALGIPLVSSMGTGNRTDPAALRLGDVGETAGNGCPLARVMRRELRRRGIARLQVVYSIQQPVAGVCVASQNGRHAPGSTAFVPPAAGFLLAYGAVKQILGL